MTAAVDADAHGRTGAPGLISGVVATVAADTPVQVDVFSSASIVLVGPSNGHHEAVFQLRSSTPEQLLAWLDLARAELVSAAPHLVEGQVPDPMLVEARAIVVEDILGPLGLEPSGESREIAEIGQADIRRARRMSARVVDILAAVIAREPTTVAGRAA